MRDFGIHPSLVDSLGRWADVQSMSLQPPLESDVDFVSDLSKRYLGLAAGMYRLMTAASNASQLFTLPLGGKDTAVTGGVSGGVTSTSMSAGQVVAGTGGNSQGGCGVCVATRVWSWSLCIIKIIVDDNTLTVTSIRTFPWAQCVLSFHRHNSSLCMCCVRSIYCCRMMCRRE